MITISGGRGSGKTQAVIRWYLDDPMNRRIAAATYESKQDILSRILACSDLRRTDVSARIITPHVELRGYKHCLLAVDDWERFDYEWIAQLPPSVNIDVITTC